MLAVHISGGSVMQSVRHAIIAALLVLVTVPAAAQTTLAAPARAADGSPFFAGKTVRILVGFSAGGGYDIYARELGRYLGRHIPGNSSIVVQPGA
jgi:tripartite-type tricarboxylate transporter receptor subunit TctC